MKWGTAPVLIQSTTKAGKIKVRASVVWQGKATPVDGYIELESVKPEYPLIGSEKEMNAIPKGGVGMRLQGNPKVKSCKEKLKEVEKQQADFE